MKLVEFNLIKKGLIMQKVLYYREYDSPVFWGYKPTHKIKSYFKFTMYFDFKEGLRFTATVPNAGFCYRNPFEAIAKALEHESIGMAKYNQLKDDIRAKGLHKNLDCSL